MTYQEANALVDDFSSVYKGEQLSRETLGECISRETLVEYKEVVCKALEKQIPKKPLNQKCGIFDFNLICPECKNRIVNVWSKREYKPNYCHYCGQALDWK